MGTITIKLEPGKLKEETFSADMSLIEMHVDGAVNAYQVYKDLKMLTNVFAEYVAKTSTAANMTDEQLEEHFNSFKAPAGN